MAKPEMDDIGVRAGTPTFWSFDVEDHQIVARSGDARLYLLNPSAQVIWEAFSASGDVAAVVEALQEVFGVARAVAERDAEATIAQWRAEGLLDAPGANPPAGEAGHHPDPASLRWRHYAIGGTMFSIGLDLPALEADIVPRLAHFAVAAVEDGAARYTVQACGGGWAVYRDGHWVDHGDSLYAARTIILFEALRAAYADEPWCANLHAGALALGDRCVIVAGESGAGKSTLSVAAQCDGLACLGDDSAPILARSGRVAATPLATMLREGSWPLFDALDEHFHVSEIVERETGRVRFLSPRCPAALRGRTPVALLFVRRRAGAAPALRALSVVEALQRLGTTGFWVRPEQEAIGQWLAWLAALPRYDLEYDTTAQGLALVRGLLEP